MKKFIIKDWMNNTCFQGKEFDSFKDAWEYIYETDPNEKDDDHFTIDNRKIHRCNENSIR